MPAHASAAPPAPTIDDVRAAAADLDGLLRPTPLWRFPALDAELGAEVGVKLESLQPTGAFKVRGGLTLLHRMPAEERARGIVGYSTGNHAQSLAYAARAHGVDCTIVMPSPANPVKAAAVRALGAAVLERGDGMVTAAEHARALAEGRGARLVSAADEPDLVTGVGSLYLEVFERAPDLDALFVPVGGGSGAAAACVVAAALAPSCRIVAVQSSAAPAAHDSWRAGRLVDRPIGTAVEGLATGSGFAYTQRIMRDGLADFTLVSDADVRAAQRRLWRTGRILVEGAGAAALAGLWARRAEFQGARVAIVCTGANARPDEIAEVTAV
ncbi:threonine ammonia-lyase [Allonocardiopsis opalescens]|uniref:threonine ammonia-lyase n=1 Tax=Allonocardiopsis opalescens TaxID=1144618 RepID=A0A2T0QCG3_9ACTN|nr:pyridoxal-phosphate dependent enzyme [Allonocardiopsis opalescens]PRY01602.1 threonine dehydratase [Allonocardiopsis opalescens]